MAGYRFNLGNGFIPDPMPQALQDKLPEIRKAIRFLFSFAKPINEGKANQELIVKGTFHKCYHDEPKPHPKCEPEQDI